jgi:hypothetical protein
MTRDLRKYARQTNVQLMAGAVLLLLVVGDGLIYLFYGGGAAILGLLCILTAIVPIALTVLAILALDWIRKRADHD